MTALQLQESLRSASVDRRSLAFEQLVLDSVGLDESDLQALGHAYQFLSTAIIKRSGGAATGSFEAPKGAIYSRSHLLAVWGLVYGWRTFELARRLISEFRPLPGLAVELGAGWGPYSLQAALHGFEVKLVEVSRTSREFTLAIFEALGLPEPIFVHREASLEDAKGASLVSLPYSLWEIRNQDDHAQRHAKWLMDLRGHSKGGRQIHIVEAGSRDASRALQGVREILAPEGVVAGPCMGVAACPRFAADDWCHFTWRNRPGPLTRRIADVAKRRWQEVHSSWLVVGKEPDHGAFRVLGTRRAGKAKLQAEFCGSDGLLRINALTRDPAVREKFESLGTSDVVSLLPEHFVEKGDGLRMLAAEGLEIREFGGAES